MKTGGILIIPEELGKHHKYLVIPIGSFCDSSPQGNSLLRQYICMCKLEPTFQYILKLFYSTRPRRIIFKTSMKSGTNERNTFSDRYIGFSKLFSS